MLQLDQFACWSMDPLDQLAFWSNGPDPRPEQTREESDEEEAGNEEVEQEYGDEPAYDNGQGYGDEREHGDEPEDGDEQEHGEEQEHGDPQQDGDEQTRARPEVPSGAEEGERAPSAEHADTAATAEEEEGEAREEGSRATDPNRLEWQYARDALQQEGRTREGEAHAVQPQGMCGRSEAEDRRTTGVQRRRAEPRDGSSRSSREPPPRAKRYGDAEGRRRGVEENMVRSAARPQAHGGSRGGEHRSPETQRHWEGRRKGGSNGGKGPEESRGRPTGAVGEREGGRKQAARRMAYGSRAREGRSGHHPQRDVSRVKPARGNGSRVTTCRHGDGNGREGRRVSGDTREGRAESSWRAGPGLASWRKGLSALGKKGGMGERGEG
ncbi:unnamed protein product [Closterium sp. Naga37s-1]|nr:unnamed protein product [Closterium sp. Naga37s-1]